MQRLTVWRKARARAAATAGNDLAVGAIAVFVSVVVLVACAVFYVRPPSQKSIIFEMFDASAVTSGQDVRVAGISVGKVSEVVIQDDRVVASARIDDSTFVGDQSRVEVRMLTPVGGYAVNLIPMGELPAPQDRIPADRVTVPYSIGDVLQSVPTVTDDVDGELVHANLGEVSRALKENPSSVREIVDGMNSVAGVLDHQRTQVHEIASVASEYLQTFNANRELVFELIRKIDIVISTYNNTKVGFNETYRLLASVLWRLQPLEKYYLDNADLLREHVDNLQTTVADIQTHMGPAIDNLMALRGQLADWMTPTGMKELGGGTVSMDNVCIPIAGREC